jgi:hypothetical protein
MEKFTSVKITQGTLKKLHMMASKLSIVKGKRLNLDETIDSLIEIADKTDSTNNLEKRETERDRKEFLKMLNHKIKGAGPDDYKSYDFEDISSL